MSGNRTRKVDFQDPALTASGAVGKSGLDFLRDIVAGKVPAPPLHATLGFQLVDVADGVARAHGVEAEVKLVPGYPVTVNDGAFDGFVQGVARELLGPRSVVELPAPFMGAEDFSYVLQKVTGSMAVIGMRPPGNEPPAPCHSNRMKLDESGMAHGAALHAAVALRYLGTGAGV